ncbi:MAG: response regulator [Candidatus Dadabacteria bacterium]|nr:response regulator [Candidatus Dadabacteria bacterium]
MPEDNFSICYVDEDEADRNTFKRHSERYGLSTECLHPDKNIEEFVQKILSLGVDAIVVDYNLKEKDRSITYSGTDLVKGIREYKKSLPCCILTSYSEEAIEQSDDVHIIYSKDPENEEDPSNLFHRLKSQIKKYHSLLLKYEERLNFLIKESEKRTLTADEEQELIDKERTIIEETGKDIKTPDHLKGSVHIDIVRELIDKSNEIISTTKKEDN